MNASLSLGFAKKSLLWARNPWESSVQNVFQAQLQKDDPFNMTLRPPYRYACACKHQALSRKCKTVKHWYQHHSNRFANKRHAVHKVEVEFYSCSFENLEKVLRYGLFQLKWLLLKLPKNLKNGMITNIDKLLPFTRDCQQKCFRLFPGILCP